MEQLHNAQDFDTTIAGIPGRTLVDFSATWCGPCRMLAPTLDELENDYAGNVAFYKVDIDECRDLAARFGINAVPTMVLFENGQGLCMMQGVQPKEAIKAMIDDETLSNH